MNPRVLIVGANLALVSSLRDHPSKRACNVKVALDPPSLPHPTVALGVLATLDSAGLEEGAIPGRPAVPGMDAVKADEAKIIEG